VKLVPVYPLVPAPQYYAGLDLGELRDFSALTILEKLTTLAGRDPVSFAWLTEIRWNVRLLKRWKLGTTYPEIIADLCDLFDRWPLRGAVRLAIDSTGAGLPVLRAMQRANLKAAGITGVVISAGSAENRLVDGRISVPKRNLVSQVAILLQQGKLKIAADLPEAQALVRELLNFRAKISETGHDTYEAWRSGDHDDLVLSAALAVWLAKPGQFVGEVAQSIC